MTAYLLDTNHLSPLVTPSHPLPDVIDAEKAAALQIVLRRQGWQLETVDALIAIIAERYQLILLTKDKDFTRVPGLRIEQWLP